MTTNQVSAEQVQLLPDCIEKMTYLFDRLGVYGSQEIRVGDVSIDFALEYYDGERNQDGSVTIERHGYSITLISTPK